MQTKKRSLTEVICNVGTGILTAYLTWVFIISPWASVSNCDLNNLNTIKIILINGVFTIVSVVRGYFWRRFFNKYN